MSVVDFIGYTALVINLTSMAMRNILLLRGFSAVANFIYVIYGVILGGCRLSSAVPSRFLYTPITF
jgi:hypothetical protein